MEKLSIMVKNVVIPLDGCNPVTQLIPIYDKGRFEAGRGWSRLFFFIESRINCKSWLDAGAGASLEWNHRRDR